MKKYIRIRKVDYDIIYYRSEIINILNKIYYYSYIIMLLNSYKAEIDKMVNAEIKIIRSQLNNQGIQPKNRPSQKDIKVVAIQKVQQEDLKVLNNKFCNSPKKLQELKSKIKTTLSTLDLHNINDANKKVESLLSPSSIAYGKMQTSGYVKKTFEIMDRAYNELNDPDFYRRDTTKAYFSNNDWVKQIPVSKFKSALKNNYNNAYLLWKKIMDDDNIIENLNMLYNPIHTLYLLVRLCKRGKVAGLDKLVKGY